MTHLHEQSPSPVGGKTTRDITIANARGEVEETRTEAYIDGIWYTIARNHMTYNSEGKKITSENLAGQVTATEWDCCHKISETMPDGSTTTWDYDDDGRMVAASKLIPLDMTNVTWLTTCYEYDDLGRQTATWQTNYAAQVGLPATRTRYDAIGRVVSRIDTLGNTTTTTYSLEGRTVSVLNPNGSTRITTRTVSGDWVSITGSAVTPEFHTHGIDADGTRWSRIVRGETAESPRFTKRYANLASVAYPGETLSFSYDADGLLVSASNSIGVVTNIYDAETGWLDASCGADGTWVAYARSDGGSITSVTSVAGTTAYSLDAAGRWTHVAAPSAAFDFGYCEWNGRLAVVTNGNGLVTEYAYDIMDRVTNISWRTTSGATIGGFSYEYDALGRIVSRGHALGTNAFDRVYAYDDFDRLSSDGGVAYTYDAAGNRMTRTEDGDTITYTLGVGDRLASWTGGAYTHDVAGNVTRIERDGKPTLDLAWNSQYQLVSVSTNGVFAEGYAYDALGRRVSTTTLEGTTRHIYDCNWQCIADIDENGNVVASYVWDDGIDNLLAVTVGGATYYPLTDIQGTVWGYVDSQNNVVASWTYDAWGNVVDECVSPSAAALATLRYRFQGREWSAATGLINFRMRWYDAETGRWLSKDPIGLSGGLNLYVFCGGDPLNYRDPDGNILIFAPALVYSSVAAAAAAAMIAANAPQIIDGIVHLSKGLINTVTDTILKGGHTKNARPSSLERHQKGDARRKRDQERSRRRKNGGNRSIPLPGGGEDGNDDSCEDRD